MNRWRKPRLVLLSGPSRLLDTVWRVPREHLMLAVYRGIPYWQRTITPLRRIRDPAVYAAAGPLAGGGE